MKESQNPKELKKAYDVVKKRPETNFLSSAVANSLKKSDSQSAANAPVQRHIIDERGAPMRDGTIRLRGIVKKWRPSHIQEALRLNAAERTVSWRSVVRKIDHSIFMENIRRRRRENLYAQNRRRAAYRREHGRALPLTVAAAPLAALLADARMPLTVPLHIQRLIEGPLEVAGRSTSAMAAIGMGDRVRAIYRQSESESMAARMWSSGRASGPDDIAEHQVANRGNGVFHAEEKVVKSSHFRDQIRRFLWENRRGNSPVDIWILINRSSCHACANTLLAGQRYVVQLAERLGIARARLVFNLSVLGQYTGGDDADRAALLRAGWRITIHRRSDGSITPSGYKHIGAAMKDNDDKR